MAARISCGLVLLVGVQALVQPPAKTEQVQVLGCGTFQPPNSTRCQDGKCLGFCESPCLTYFRLPCFMVGSEVKHALVVVWYIGLLGKN